MYDGLNYIKLGLDKKKSLSIMHFDWLRKKLDDFRKSILETKLKEEIDKYFKDMFKKQ